jgi:hypothetical protein
VKIKIIKESYIDRSQKKYVKDKPKTKKAKGVIDKTRPPAELDRLKYIQARDPDEPDEFEHGMSGVREVEAVVLPQSISELWDHEGFDFYPFYENLDLWFSQRRRKQGKDDGRIVNIKAEDGSEYSGGERAIIYFQVEARDMSHNKKRPAGAKDWGGYGGPGWDVEYVEERKLRETKVKVKILREDVKKKSTKEKYFGSVVTQLKKNPELAIDSTWIMTSPALGRSLGHGYSRTVYEIPENKNLVIKLAKSSQVKAGSFTNAQEVKHFNKYPEFFPKVYESGKTNWERQSVTRADHADWVTKTDVKEFPKVLWLIVDKVIPINDQTEYWDFIHKSFPQLVEAAGMLAKSSGEGRSSLTPTQALIALWEIMMEASWEAGDTSRKTPAEAVTAIAQLILETRYWELRKVLSFKNEPDANVMGAPDKEWLLKRQDMLDEAKKIYNAVGKDTKLARLMKLCDETGIDSNDIRHENVGTDIATKTKFILLDIGIFLNDYLVKAPAVDASMPPPL